MSERKNHLTIDGGVVKEDEHVASYKPIPEADTEFRNSKSSLSKSKEKVTTDEAEEKLLKKEEEAKIVTRVDMAEAKYVVGDHRNGDAKIELDANKKFSGLTKEELLKYADDPFWVRLRWFMFILFWAMWLAMLAGAIAIIVRAPKCYPPPAKTWYESGPLVDMSEYSDYRDLEPELDLLQEMKVAGLFVKPNKPTYEVLEDQDIPLFKEFNDKAKARGIKVIIDLIANYVNDEHMWFKKSEEKDPLYKDYFIWAPVTERDDANNPVLPNKWVSHEDKPAWTYSAKRDEFFLHQYGDHSPDLNFDNPDVKKNFQNVISMWMKAGADGIRLSYARDLLVNKSLSDEEPATGAGSTPGADHTQYAYWRHSLTSDLPQLDDLLRSWGQLVDSQYTASPNTNSSVFTLREDGERPELFLMTRSWRPRPALAAPLNVGNPDAAARLNKTLPTWPALQLVDKEGSGPELAALSLLLPAAPVFTVDQLQPLLGNSTDELKAKKSFKDLVSLRSDATIQHGSYSLLNVPCLNSSLTVLVCARWKAGHTGYAALYNPHGEEAWAELSAAIDALDDIKLYHASAGVLAEYTSNAIKKLEIERVLVPAKSTVVVSYLPQTSEAS